MSPTSAPADHVGDLLRTATDDRLARELLSDVEAIVRSVLGPRDRHLVQTAAHDALLAVVHHRGGFRGDSRGSTWLYVITRREALRAAAREARRGAVEISLDEKVHRTALGALSSDPSADAVLVAWELLEERVPNRHWRRMWLLHNDPDTRLSHAEIARRCGRTEGTVAVTLSRVRRRLAQGPQA